MPDHDFTWRDGDRTIRFGRGALDDAPGLLGEGYLLLTTARSAAAAPALADAPRRASCTSPRDGWTTSPATSCRTVGRPHAIVALGGGRVIDVAKAIGAALGPGTVVAAVPTTLSAAEMTWVHRHARGVDAADAARAPADRPQRPGAQRLAAAPRACRERRERARPRGRGVRDGARLPRPDARRPGRGAAARRARCPRPASPIATSWRSGRCSPATRSTRTGTACTTS